MNLIYIKYVKFNGKKMYKKLNSYMKILKNSILVGGKTNNWFTPLSNASDGVNEVWYNILFFL